jgi:hypothetical protein
VVMQLAPRLEARVCEPPRMRAEHDLAVAVRLTAEARQWAVMGTLSRQLDALRREREGGGLTVIDGELERVGIGEAMSAQAPSVSSPSADGASSEPARSTPTVGARGRWVLHHGDALAVLRSMPDASVDAVITEDPPYSSGGFTRGTGRSRRRPKCTMNGTKMERARVSGDNRHQRSFAYWCALWLG